MKKRLSRPSRVSPSKILDSNLGSDENDESRPAEKMTSVDHSHSSSQSLLIQFFKQAQKLVDQKDPAMFPLQIASLTSIATLIRSGLTAISSQFLTTLLSCGVALSLGFANAFVGAFVGAFVVVSALAFAPAPAWAQADDSGDFTEGDEGTPPNTDSDPVPGLTMLPPSYAGTGCPQGTASTILSPDGKSLTVIFDAYIAQANAGVPRDQKGCQINIPFQVPAGYQVQVVKMDYRGFANLPQGARSTFGAGFRYLEIDGRGTPNPRVLRARVLQGPRQKEFKLTSILRGARFSPCGANFILAAESMLNVAANRQGEDAFATVDSLDGVALPVVYSLRWKSCSAGPGGGQGGGGRVRPEPPPRPNPGRTPRPFPGPGRR
jgi:hypothetical protein